MPEENPDYWNWLHNELEMLGLWERPEVIPGERMSPMTIHGDAVHKLPSGVENGNVGLLTRMFYLFRTPEAEISSHPAIARPEEIGYGLLDLRDYNGLEIHVLNRESKPLFEKMARDFEETFGEEATLLEDYSG